MTTRAIDLESDAEHVCALHVELAGFAAAAEQWELADAAARCALASGPLTERDSDRVHGSHGVLGLVALHHGRAAAAKAALAASVAAPAVTRLARPDYRLAVAMLTAGHVDEVLAFLDGCGRAGVRPADIAFWADMIRRGHTPTFRLYNDMTRMGLVSP